MENNIKREEINEIIKNYLLTEGREIILEILKEQTGYFITSTKAENLKEEIGTKEEKIKLSSDIVDKKEAIKDFIKELEKYNENEKVEIEVRQLK